MVCLWLVPTSTYLESYLQCPFVVHLGIVGMSEIGLGSQWRGLVLKLTASFLIIGSKVTITTQIKLCRMQYRVHGNV